MFRKIELERDIMYASKCEFVLNNADIKTLQKALPVTEGENNSLCLSNNIEIELKIGIERNIPAFPRALPMYGFVQQYQGAQPQIKRLIDTDFGQRLETLYPCPCKFPVLNVVADNIFGDPYQIPHFARQIGTALGISDQWDDQMMKNAGAWQEAKIEYAQYDIARQVKQGEVFPIMDNAGHIRNLIIKIYIDPYRYILLPLTFAQHPNFPQPMVCHHAFSPDWWLLYANLLKYNPHAEVIISNYWEICEKALWNEKNAFLGYFWGEGMIPHLHLECLVGRKVKLLIIESSDRVTTRQNLSEAVLLQSRLKAMNINAGILLAKDESIFEAIPNLIQSAKSITTDTLVNMAKSLNIDIPDNLSPNRFGMLSSAIADTLVEGFAESGTLTAITIHDNVDMTLITISVLAGILRQGSIFPDYWRCNSRIVPECFVIGSTANRYNRIFKQLAPDDNFKFRGLGSLKKDGVTKCLNGICHENDSDIFIFSGREIVKEYQKELKESCDWAIKKNKAIVVVTSHDGSASENFIADHAGRDIHVWNSGKKQSEYIIEDRPLLGGKPSFFKIEYKGNAWTTAAASDDEIRNIDGRNFSMTNTSENSGEKAINNYRRY